MTNRNLAVYASFDTFPAPKGAAVHISHFAPALFDFVGKGLLLTLGDYDYPKWQLEGNIEIKRLISPEENFLNKAMEFASFVYERVAEVKDNLRIAHFRDPWSGVPIIEVLNGKVPLVFEVNALPSVEISSRFSSVASSTLEKIREDELFCLEKADAIVCPSAVIKEFLESLGVDGQKITVIPNGAVLNHPKFEPWPDAPKKYIIYIGAVQAWQGIDVLMKAMTFLKDIPDLHLVICAAGAKPRIKYLQKLCARMEIDERVHWHLRQSQLEVQRWLQNSLISIAPLTECERNLVQGCCPIKIVESMAAGIPVIASDMPVTRELLQHRETGWLVRPDRPSELARAIRLLLAHEDDRIRIGATARQKVSENFTWEHSILKLQNVYGNLAGS